MSLPSVVIVGAGLMGRWHAHYARAAGAKVVAVVDRDRKKAQDVARATGAAVFENAEDCYQQCQSSVVHLCTPESDHVRSLESALRAQKHVLVEKPLCPDADETDRLYAEADRAGLKLCPVHQFPFQDGFLKLLSRRAKLGDLVRVEFFTCSAGGEKKSAEERGAIMLGILPHPMSLFTRLLPESIRSADLNLLSLSDDDLELSGLLGGTGLSIVVSMRGRPTRNELRVVGTKTSAFVDLFHGYVVFEGGRTSRLHKMMRPFKYGSDIFLGAGTNLLKRAVEAEPAYPGLGLLIERFYQSVQTGGECPISAQETLESARLSDKIRSLKYPQS